MAACTTAKQSYASACGFGSRFDAPVILPLIALNLWLSIFVSVRIISLCILCIGILLHLVRVRKG